MLELAAVESARNLHAGVPQGSKPVLFSFYTADLPDPTTPIKRVCYADDISVWASGSKLLDIEQKINSYMSIMFNYIVDNSLLISAPKSTVTLFMLDPAQANTHPRIMIDGAKLPLVKILGVYLDLHQLQPPL